MANDVLTEIELGLQESLYQIDMAVPLGSYTFFNTVTQVNVGDEAIATELGSYPVCNIEQTTSESVQNSSNIATTSTIDFEIHGMVSAEVDPQGNDSPRFIIRKKMNELYSDIKCVIGNNQGQICWADTVDVVSMRRVYYDSRDVFRVGEIVVTVRIRYMQDRLNPLSTC